MRDDDTLKALVDVAHEVRTHYLTKGTKKNPAETCKDLAMSDPETKDGLYWIDPNGGNVNDAVQAWCNIKKHETCIDAKPNKIFRGKWYRGPATEGYKLFSEMGGDAKRFTYKADGSQLRFLQIKSSEAAQTIAYHCRNSIAVTDGNTGTKAHALKLTGDNDVEFTHDGLHGKKYELQGRDGCSNKWGGSKWSKTKLTISTTKTDRLPIVDFETYNTDQQRNMQFGLEISSVCFS